MKSIVESMRHQSEIESYFGDHARHTIIPQSAAQHKRV